MARHAKARLVFLQYDVLYDICQSVEQLRRKSVLFGSVNSDIFQKAWQDIEKETGCEGNHYAKCQILSLSGVREYPSLRQCYAVSTACS
jgi:hypothetical protein